MNASTDSLHRIRESSPRPLAAFIGSGLSVPEPSSLPLGKELVVSLLGLDWVHGDELFPISESQIENSDLCKIRFEHLLSIFSEWGKHDIALLLRQFADAPPNWYHDRISVLCRERIIDCIVTTNFDACLEKALAMHGVAHNVVVTEDDDYSEDRCVTNVFKIHGTIERRGVDYSARGLGATLESLASGLPAWKQALLFRLLNQYTFVVLGYSGSDSYDISPTLHRVSDKYLYWVAHATRNHDVHLSPELAEMLARSPYSKIVHMDTAEFLGGSPLPRRQVRFRFTPTYNLDNHWHPSVFVGRVLESVGEYRGAQQYYEEVVEESTPEQYWQVEQLNLLRANAVTSYELGEYQAANHWLQTAQLVLLDYDRRMKADGSTPEDLRSEIFLDQFLLIMEEKALVHSALGDHEDAIESIECAFKSLKALQRIRGYGRTQLSVQSRLLLNRSTVQLNLLQEQVGVEDGEYLIVLEDAKRARAIKQEIGDVPGLILCLGLLGQIYASLGVPRSAVSMFLQMFVEMQKLSTPFAGQMAAKVAGYLGPVVYLNVSRDKADNVRAYLRHQSAVRTRFENRILSLLTDGVHRDGNRAWQSVLQDGVIQSDSQRLKEELNDWRQGCS